MRQLGTFSVIALLLLGAGCEAAPTSAVRPSAVTQPVGDQNAPSPVTAVIGRSVSGRITDAETGEPLAGLAVIVSKTPSVPNAISDRDGKYSLAFPESAGTSFEIYVGRGNWYEPSEVKKVDLGAATAADFALRSKPVEQKGFLLKHAIGAKAIDSGDGSTRLVGQVTKGSATGAAAEGVNVLFIGSNTTATTDKDGRFSLDVPQGGTQRVYLLSERLDFPEEKDYYQINVPPGTVVTADFVIHP